MQINRARRPSRAIAWLGVLALLAGACAPSAAQPAPAAPAAAVAPAAAPAAPPASAASMDSAALADWDQTLAAARQEGTLALSGTASELWRRGLMLFEQEYPDIKVEYNGFSSRDFWTRLFQERQNGQYLWDLRVGGPDPQVFDARDLGYLDPVRPLLVLPEVVDDDRWIGGVDGIWADNARTHILVFLANAKGVVSVNRDLVSESELPSEKELLAPRWKGKLSLQDPRGGSGLGDLTVLLASHGEDYIRALLGQDPTVTTDARQQAEWIARGRYPIGLGVVSHVLLFLQNEGVGRNVKILTGGHESLSIAAGGIEVFDRRPHPNATKVFVNWLLTQRAQAELTKLIELNSRRVDVPPAKADEVVDRQRLDKYVDHQSEQWLTTRRRAVELSNEMLR